MARQLIRRFARLAGAFAAAVVLAACSGGDAASSATVADPASAITSSSTAATVPTGTESGGTTSPAAATTSPPTPVVGGLTVGQIDVAGAIRTYELYVPDSLGDAAPLVIDLHGLSGTPADEDDLSGMRAKADAEGFVVVQPAAFGGIPVWDPSPRASATVDDVGFMRALVDALALQVPIDRNRVFAVGFSNGGGLVHRLACDAADVFSGFASVSGAYTFAEPCTPARPVSVLAIHGDADPVVPLTGAGELLPDVRTWAQGWAERNGCDGSTTVEVAPDVERTTWEDCDDGVRTELYVVEGGGHGWPGTASVDRRDRTTASISATDVIWAFFTDS